MPSPLETWFSEIPPVTRIYVAATCCTSIAVYLGFIHPLQLWLNYESIVHDFQWWRLITNFFYFGPLSIDFCFHVFFLARYSRMVEEGFYRNKPADYAWLMIFSASILIILSILVPFAYLPFMGSSLSFTMVYIWARRNPYVRLNFLGLVVITAPYLPWVLLLFSLCLGGQAPIGDILGVLVGHIYYFFEDVWPRDPLSQGKKWLATPRLIRWLVEGNRPRDDSIELNDTPAVEAELAVAEAEATEPEGENNTIEERTGEESRAEERQETPLVNSSEKSVESDDEKDALKSNSNWIKVEQEEEEVSSSGMEKSGHSFTIAAMDDINSSKHISARAAEKEAPTSPSSFTATCTSINTATTTTSNNNITNKSHIAIDSTSDTSI